MKNNLIFGIFVLATMAICSAMAKPDEENFFEREVSENLKVFGNQDRLGRNLTKNWLQYGPI